MTESTEQEIAAAWNAQADELNQWDELDLQEKIEWAAKFGKNQADHLVHVVPKGWRLVPIEPTEVMLATTSWPVCAKTDYQHMLAAAPQPPEATVNDSLTVEASPVQMPDALLSLEVDAHYIFNNPPCECPQVVRDVIEWYAGSIRQILAAHGITN